MKQLIFTILAVILASCSTKSPSFDYRSMMDSLRNENIHVLDIPSLQRFVYVIDDGQDDVPYAWFHSVDYQTGEDGKCKVSINEYSKYLLSGESDSLACLISEGGSGGFCMFTRIDVVGMKELEHNINVEPQGFIFEERTARGYKGTGTRKLAEDGYDRILETFEINFHGNTIAVEPLQE